MSVALYFDENVNSIISLSLRRLGVDVLTVQEDGWGRRPDEEILERATELGRVIVTNDRDFLVLASDCQHQGVPFSGVIYFHLADPRLRRIRDDLEPIGKVSHAAEFADQVVYLPL